jgi:hypothetical protein
VAGTGSYFFSVSLTRASGVRALCICLVTIKLFSSYLIYLLCIMDSLCARGPGGAGGALPPVAFRSLLPVRHTQSHSMGVCLLLLLLIMSIRSR